MSVLSQLLRRYQVYRSKPRHWRLRGDTIDGRLFRQVVVENEYRLPARLDPADVVVDIGGHIGSFGYAVLRRGAGQVHCFEPQAGNFRLLRHNLAPFGQRAEVRQAAVWRSDQEVRSLSMQTPDRHSSALPEPARDPRNTGAGRVAEQGDARVPVVRFDDLIRGLVERHGRRVRLVKLDCEGAEWPILFTSRALDQVEALCGEFHAWELPELYRVAGFPEFAPAALSAHLRAQGFATRMMTESRCRQLGYFFAWRRPFGDWAA